MIGKHIRNILQKIGLDIVRYSHISHPVARRMRLLSHYNIDLIFDIGANIGQYAKEIRKAGYRGRIVSFEPVKSAYHQLVKNAQDDPLWETVNIALGDVDGISEINISQETHSSSILRVLPSSLVNCPSAKIVETEEITVKKVDAIARDYFRTDQRLYLKIDTQGFEKKVIEGAANCLENVVGIEMEVSLAPIYEGETLFGEMFGLITRKGFTLMGINPGLSDYATGQLLQMDCIFFR